MKIPETPAQALWLSAEHWLAVYEDPLNVPIGGQYCSCCHYSDSLYFTEQGGYDNPRCYGCPIARDHGKHCEFTPYYAAQKAIADYTNAEEKHVAEPNGFSILNEEFVLRGLKEIAKSAVEREYKFLVEMALDERISEKDHSFDEEWLVDDEL